VIAAASKAGAKFPQVVAAQWALESGYGKHTSGKNNFFGLKGEGSERETKEFINGQWVTIKAGFIDFPDLQTCVTYLVDRWYRDYQRFKGVNRATSAEECAKLLVVEKYATDPAYADKLIRILRKNV
jgi:flagellum-specific peptidoglycan hydrolase FlgJ